MRILLLCERNPSFLNYGGTLRTYNLSKNLTKRDNTVFIIHFINHKDGKYSDKTFLKDVAEDTFSVEFPDFYDTICGKFYKILVSMPLGKNMSFKHVCIRDVENKIKKIIESYKIDLIHVQGPVVGLTLKNFHDVPKILDLTDSLSLYFKRKNSMEKDSNRNFRNYFLYIWSKGIEKNLLTNSDITTVVSHSDKCMLESLCSKKRVEVIPNGVDADLFSPKSKTNEIFPSVVFHGNMDFSPNIHSVKHIVEQVLPLIKSKIPNVKFFVVGGNPSKEIKDLESENNIIVTGYVKDIREYISKASVGLYPMKSGSGIKNKILEAMAMEKPVVSNHMGIEALSEKAKECILIGETSGELADHVVKLLRDEKLRIELGKKSRKVMIEEYSWENVAGQYELLYKSLMGESER